MANRFERFLDPSYAGGEGAAPTEQPAVPSTNRFSKFVQPQQPAAAPSKTPLEQAGFAASRIGTALPHLAEFAVDTPQHLGALAQFGVSGEKTGVSADMPDTARAFEDYAASTLGAPDFAKYPGQGYEPAKIGAAYKTFLALPQNESLLKRRTEAQTPEAYKALPMLGSEVLSGQLAGAAEGIKDVTGGAVDLNKTFRGAETPEEQLIEGVVEGVVTGGTGLPRAAVRAAVPTIAKRVTAAEAASLRREIAADLITGGVGGYTGTLAAQNAPEGWEMAAGLAGGLAGGVGAVGAMHGLDAATRSAADYLRPAIPTKGNVERLASDALKAASSDPAAAAEAIRTSTAPEGVRYTAGQAANDTGLLNLEQTLARGKDQEFREAMIERAAEQNRAMVENLRAVEENGSPAAVSEFFASRMNELTTRAAQLNENARRLAEADASRATDAPEAAEVGAVVQDALEAEMGRVRDEIAALDRAIDPSGTMQLPTRALRNTVDETYARMSPEERLSITPEERALIDIITKYGDVLPYSRFRDLRTQINEDMRNARTAGKGRAYGRMSQLRGALETDIKDAIAGRAARDATAANNFVREARDWYENRVGGEARPGAGASPVGAAPARTPAVPEASGAAGARVGEPGAPARDTGLPEDAAARRAVEGGGRFEQSAKKYPIAPRSEWYGEANYETTGGRMSEMSPDDFLARARPLQIDDVSRDNIDDLKRHIQSGGTLDPLKFFEGGKEDGRHRAIAAKELGIERVPVIEFGDQKRPPKLFQSGTVSNPGAEHPRPFYSAALKSVEDSKTNRASPQQWAATIKNTPGVKREELDWLGLNSWLAAQKGPVTKEQVADFIRANQIEVEEVNLAGGDSSEAMSDLGRRIDWEADEVDEDFVRELAAERAAADADDLREYVSRDEGIEPEDVTDEQIEDYAFRIEMAGRQQEPDGYHASVTVDTPEGQVTYELNRDSSGSTSIYVDGRSVKDYEYMDEGDIRDALREDYAENYAAAEDADGPTQYGEYTLPGGKDYHELLLKLPERRGDNRITPPSEAVGAKYKDQWEGITQQINDLGGKMLAMTEGDRWRDAPFTPEYKALQTQRSNLEAERDALHAKMVQETLDNRPAWQKGENFEAPHYDDQSQNILAHVRFKERTSVDGKRTLFLEEVQSDWHQQGRDKGYKRDLSDEEKAHIERLSAEAQLASDAYRTAINRLRDEEDGLIKQFNAARQAGDFTEVGRLNDAIQNVQRRASEVRSGPLMEEMGRTGRALQDASEKRPDHGVPDAPFKTTWPELALKRMIRWAADNGYDQIAWTPGSVQNARYGLSQHVDQIEWVPMTDAVKKLRPNMASAERVVTLHMPRRGTTHLYVDGNGRVIQAQSMPQADGKPLAEVIGKELAQQIMADAEGQITKAGLAEIGGSGMREFYDRVMVSLGNKLGKKFGTQVGKAEFGMPRGMKSELGIAADGNLVAAALPITPEMREGALRGQPLFQKVHEAATSPENNLSEPSQAQKEAGNYKKGHVKLGGLDLSIENPAGSTRSGTDASGKPWSVDMKDHYGYIKGTVGRDKDHLDVFVSRDAGELSDNAPVFIVDQIDPKTGKFDEAKIMIGYPDRTTAEAAYKANYSRGWKGMGAITPTTMRGLKDWIGSGKTRGQFAKSGFERAPSIAETMAERFAGAGRPDAEARAAGSLVDAFYSTLARRAGQTVDELQEQFPLPRVEKGGAAGDMNQSRTPKAEPDRDLYAVHNIKPGGVLNADKIGGLPMPSLAVAHIGKGDFGNFGDISLIGSPKLVDPKGGTGAKSYDADVYSPRYPSITYDIDDKAFSALNKQAVAAANGTGGEGYRTGIDLQRLEDRGPAEAIESMGLKRMFLRENNALPEIVNKADGTPDYWANDDATNAAIKPVRDEYDAWALGKVGPLVKRERIFKGFDYNGNRRYREHNIDNVLSDMRARLKEGEGFMYGVGTIRSKHAKQFRSLDAIRKDKNRLTGTDEMKGTKDEFGDRFFALADEMKPYYRFDAKGFGYADDVASMFGEMAKKGQRALDEGFEDLPSEIRQKVSTYLTDLRNAPTEYFETKINRNVGLNEFEAALVPTGTQPRVIEALKRAGLKIVEYDKSQPNARTEAIKRLNAERGPDDGLLFQDQSGARGSILLGRDGAPALIKLFEKADASTALHESAHQFLDMFSRVAGDAKAADTLKRDWRATNAWWEKNARDLAKDAGEGVTPEDVRKVLRGERIGEAKESAVTRGMHEQWARAFEVYLRDGKAPNAAMKGLFDQFKDWLTKVYQSITGMGVNVSPDIRGVFDRMLAGEQPAAPGNLIDAAAAKRLSDVTGKWKEFYGTYSDRGANPVPAIVKRSKGETYPHDMPAENVTKAVWRPGPDGAAAIRNVLKAAGSRRDAVIEGIEQSAMLSLARLAMKDGVVDPTKFEAWKAKHADALRLVPNIARKMESAADATREMQRIAAVGEKAAKDVQKTAIGELLRLGPDASDADVSRKVGSIIERQGAVKAVRELVGAAQRDPDALAGLRRATVDHVLSRFGRDDDRLVHQTMRNWVNKHRAALAEVLTPDQMNTINAIMDASERITRKVVAPLGGSPTAEYLSALEARGESPSMLAAVLQRTIGNAVQSGIVGGVGHVVSGMNLGVGVNSAIAAFLSKAGLDMLRARGFSKADALLREAILDPALARALLMKPPRRKGAGAAKELERALSAGAIGLLSGSGEADRRRTHPPASRAETRNAMPAGVGG